MKKEQFLEIVEKMIEANKVAVAKYGEFSPADWLSELGAWVYDEFATDKEQKEIEEIMPDMK